MTAQYISSSSGQTTEIAKRIGERLKGGEVIELVSDIGGGKTTFVKGLAQGLGFKGLVSSPTFTLNQVYEGDRMKLQHFDFYRLDDLGIMKDELKETLGSKDSVMVIEWGGLAQSFLPENRLIIKIKVLDENKRRLDFSMPDSLKYLNISNTLHVNS